MKKALLLTLFLFISNFIFSQEIAIQGEIKNCKNGEPISFAAISVYKELKGISSNDNGNFYLTLPADYLNKKLVISSIGFNDTIIDVNLLTGKKKLIKLVPKQYEIAEAIIIAQKKKEIVIDKLKKSFLNQYSTTGPSDPKIVAKYFKYKPEYNGFYLKEINIFFDREFDYNISPIFIVRIFSKDTLTDTPGNDLIEKTVLRMVLSKPKLHYKYTYQLENPILFPKSGVYIGIEWIAINENKHKVYKSIVYAPTLSAKMRDKEETNLWEFYGGTWKLKKSTNNINTQPYIELRLIN